jgi:hypothetical protein
MTTVPMFSTSEKKRKEASTSCLKGFINRLVHSNHTLFTNKLEIQKWKAPPMPSLPVIELPLAAGTKKISMCRWM